VAGVRPAAVAAAAGSSGRHCSNYKDTGLVLVLVLLLVLVLVDST